jgi:hypothetical protein
MNLNPGIRENARLLPTESRGFGNLILKLRWLGMEDEAEGLRQQMSATVIPIAGPHCWPNDTD